MDFRWGFSDWANDFIDQMNALCNRHVVCGQSDSLASMQMVSQENSLLYLSRSDLKGALAGKLGSLDVGTNCTSTPGKTLCLNNPGLGIKKGPRWYSPVISQRQGGIWQIVGSAPTIGLACRSKTSSATLCGYSELQNPSVPPKKYLNYSKSGTLYRCDYSASPCTPPAAPVNANGTLTSTHGGVTATLTYTYTYEGVIGGFLSWKLVTSVSFTGSPVASGQWVNTSTPNTSQPGNIIVTSPQTYHINANTTSATGWHHELSISADGSGAGNVNVTTDLSPPGTLVHAYRDVWNISQSYSVSPCTQGVETNNSQQYDDDSGSLACPLNSGGTASGFPGDPDASLVTVTKTPTSTKQVGSASCVQIVADYWSASGSILEQITNEDTEDAAEARVTAGLGWDMVGVCGTYRTSRGPGEFTFYFRYAECAAQLNGMFIGQDYLVTFALGKRPWGSSQPYQPDGTIEVNVTATQESEQTPWQVMPEETGFEIIVVSVTVTESL